jgi:hypothetical protein
VRGYGGAYVGRGRPSLTLPARRPRPAHMHRRATVGVPPFDFGTST